MSCSTFFYLTCPVLTCPDLTCPDLTISDFILYNLTCPELTCPDLTCPDLISPDLTYADLTSPDLNYPDLTCPDFPFAECKIYYCRLVRLGLWETFHNKLSGNIIPRRLVGTLSVMTFPCSHKICRNTPYNKPSGTKPKLALWEHLLHVLIALPYDDNDYVGTHTWVTQTVSLYYLSTLLISIRK